MCAAWDLVFAEVTCKVTCNMPWSRVSWGYYPVTFQIRQLLHFWKVLLSVKLLSRRLLLKLGLVSTGFPVNFTANSKTFILWSTVSLGHSQLSLVRTLFQEMFDNWFCSQGDTIKIWYCPSCMLPDDGSPMVGCDKCDEWYHWWDIKSYIFPAVPSIFVTKS